MNCILKLNTEPFRSEVKVLDLLSGTLRTACVCVWGDNDSQLQVENRAATVEATESRQSGRVKVEKAKRTTKDIR